MRSSDLTRTIDGLAGSAAATMIGALRERRQRPANPRRIVIIQPTAIGDTLISSACIRAIAEGYPEAETILAHGPSNASAVHMLNASIRPVPVRFANPVEAVQKLRALSPDMVIDLCPWPFTTAIAARLSAPWVAGFVPLSSRRGGLLDLAVPHRTDLHESRNLAAMAEALGVMPRPGLAIRRDHKAMPPDLDPANLILCHVCAGGTRAKVKTWPPGHWAKLMNVLSERGYRIGLTGAPTDGPMVEAILRQTQLPISRAFSLCGSLPLQALAELLADAALLVSVDTGILHLSAAVEGRAIGLHGPTSAMRWGSLSASAAGLDAPHPDAGYMNYGWEDHPSAEFIMTTLTPDRVISAAYEILTTSRAA